MDYSKLIAAVEQHDRATINKLTGSLINKMINFLRIHMNAQKQDAEDCAHDAMIATLEIIKKGKLRDENQIVGYLLTTCRNNFLNLCKEDPSYPFNEVTSEYKHSPRQVSSILDKERQKMLERCLEKLSTNYRKFIAYWFHYPDSSSKAASTRFGISVNNVWTRKHRAIQQLNDCYEKKIEK